MPMRLIAILAVVVVSSQAKGQMSTFRLSNGVTVTVNTIEQANDVAMETMYDVGFMQEPEGMVQASHLLEHLVCYSPGEDFADREAKRCYQETDFVEANTHAGMLKHAFMACSHAWRFRSPRALVRGGMETFELEKMKSFHSQYYNPSHLTIAITGSISEKDARQLLEKHIGSIAAGEVPRPGIEWSKVQNRQTIRWDSKVRGVCVAWQPPSQQSERTALSIMGLLAMQKLSSDPGLKSKCDHVSCSNNIWPVGDVPLFAYATVRNTGDVDEIERLLAERFKELLTGSCEEAALQIVPFATQAKHGMTWAQIQQAAPLLMKQGRSETTAIQLCLMQDALNRVLHSRLFGSEWANGNDAVPSLDAKELGKLVDRVLTSGSQRVVHILPMDEPESGARK